MKPFYSKLVAFSCGVLLSSVLASATPVFAADAALIERVKNALEARDYTAAETDLNAALALNPYDEAALTHKIRLFYFMGKSTEGLALADMVLREYPRNVEVLNVRGLLRTKDDPQNAMEDYNAAVQISPTFFKALANRAKLNFMMGRNNAALEDINGALKLQPNQGTLLFIRATILEALDKKNDALADYDAAIATDPQVGTYYANRAALRLSLIQTTEEKEAWEMVRNDFERALQFNPKDSKALTTQGWHYFFMGNDVSQAFRSFHAAYLVDRDSPLTRQGLEKSAKKYKESTNDESTIISIWQDACAEFEKANYSEVSWQRLEWASALLRLHAGMRDNSPYETAYYLDMLLDKDPRNVRLNYYRNSGYFRAENDAKLRSLVEGDGRTRDARFTALAAIALAQSEMSQATISSAAEIKESYRRALDWCEKAIDIVPDLPEAAKMMQTISARIQAGEQLKVEKQERDTQVAVEFQEIYRIYSQWVAYKQSQVSQSERTAKAMKDAMKRRLNSSNKNDQYAVERYKGELKEIYNRINNNADPARAAIRKFRDTHSNIPQPMQKMLTDMSTALNDAATAYETSKDW